MYNDESMSSSLQLQLRLRLRLGIDVGKGSQKANHKFYAQTARSARRDLPVISGGNKLYFIRYLSLPVSLSVPVFIRGTWSGFIKKLLKVYGSTARRKRETEWERGRDASSHMIMERTAAKKAKTRRVSASSFISTECRLRPVTIRLISLSINYRVSCQTASTVATIKLCTED